MQCCNRRLLEFSEIVGKERVQVTFSLELALFQLHWHMANGLSKYTQTRSAFWRYWFYSKAPLWMQITPFSKQPQAGSDCGFATFGKHPTVHPDIVWAKLVFLNIISILVCFFKFRQPSNKQSLSGFHGWRGEACSRPDKMMLCFFKMKIQLFFRTLDKPVLTTCSFLKFIFQVLLHFHI